MNKIIYVFLLLILLVGCSKNTVQLEPQNVEDILYEASSSPSEIINTNEEEAIFVCISGIVKNVDSLAHSFVICDIKNDNAKIHCVVSDTRFDNELTSIVDGTFLTCTGKVMEKDDLLYFVVTDLNNS